jgi:hypothetical protein
MRNAIIVALAAITLANFATSSEAATVVRDHRTPPVVRDHRQPTEVRDHRGANGGVTVTSSQPRPKKQKACLLGVVCTSNKTVVGVVDKSISPRMIPR